MRKKNEKLGLYVLAMKISTGPFRFHRLVASASVVMGVCALSPSLAHATQTLVIETMTLPSGTVGQAYSAQLNTCLYDTAPNPATCAADTSTSTWSVASFSLPAGLTLSSTTGLISGTPTNAATYSFTIQATNGTFTVQKIFSISIASPSTTACAAPSGTCWYVSTAGSNSNSGTSRAAPLLTIQCAADKVNPGDV
jgi:putative Ig domain-containing protein